MKGNKSGGGSDERFDPEKDDEKSPFSTPIQAAQTNPQTQDGDQPETMFQWLVEVISRSMLVFGLISCFGMAFRDHNPLIPIAWFLGAIATYQIWLGIGYKQQKERLSGNGDSHSSGETHKLHARETLHVTCEPKHPQKCRFEIKGKQRKGN